MQIYELENKQYTMRLNEAEMVILCTRLCEVSILVKLSRSRSKAARKLEDRITSDMAKMYPTLVNSSIFKDMHNGMHRAIDGDDSNVEK